MLLFPICIAHDFITRTCSFNKLFLTRLNHEKFRLTIPSFETIIKNSITAKIGRIIYGYNIY